MLAHIGEHAALAILDEYHRKRLSRKTTTQGLTGRVSDTVFSNKLRYIASFGLVEMAISTNPKPAIYHNLYENMGPDVNHRDFLVNRLELLHAIPITGIIG